MKTNGSRIFIYRIVLLILLSLYFTLVFGQVAYNSVEHAVDNNKTTVTFLPKLLSFEGISSDKQVKLNWKFETVKGLDECILERADKSNEFKPVAYFFMTEDINIPDLKYTDKVLKSKKYSYRLKLTGKDGSTDFSKTIIIKS